MTAGRVAPTDKPSQGTVSPPGRTSAYAVMLKQIGSAKRQHRSTDGATDIRQEVPSLGYRVGAFKGADRRNGDAHQGEDPGRERLQARCRIDAAGHVERLRHRAVGHENRQSGVQRGLQYFMAPRPFGLLDARRR